MSINGKLDDFERGDLLALGSRSSLSQAASNAVIDEVSSAVTSWRRHASSADVPESIATDLEATFRRL